MIAFTRRWCFPRIAVMRPISSPGSMTMASPLLSSPKIEQLHCSAPTGRISWIIIVYSNYGPYFTRGARRVRAMDPHRVRRGLDRRVYLCPLRAGSGAGFASDGRAGVGWFESSERFSPVDADGADPGAGIRYVQLRD